MSFAPGAQLVAGGVRFAVRAPAASQLWLCLFENEAETRHPMTRDGEWHICEIAGAGPGTLYGYRADGVWAPDEGLWFDPAKLLVDPYAVELDRAFVEDPRLAIYGEDTAALVPRGRVCQTIEAAPITAPRFTPGGLIYEINVRGFTMLHPDIAPEQRGTIAALRHPEIIAHLQKLHVSAIELMPITAWIDERHLPPLGLRNAWGYNPVVPMALDPRLAPGGVAELRETVAAMHQAGIGVILDLVFNHSGESDRQGGVLSLRGLDARGSYAHAPDGTLINDSGTGNTLDFAQPAVRQMMRDTLRHFVSQCGIDGFRFDLAPILARGPGFDAHAPIFAELAEDPLLADRVMIAEPWDIGPGGYQLGRFPSNWLEWNDRYRDDIRRFWRGDGSVATLATRLCGSDDIFDGAMTRSVNFIAAHDGFTLADLTAYVDRHNHANGEDNRDGHGENFSWNQGVEGPTDDPQVNARRDADRRALLATLFASRGTIMLCAGDEFARSQQGNNNGYAQDNAIGWIDWETRDRALEDFVATLATFRAAHPQLSGPDWLGSADWRRLDGGTMTVSNWQAPETQGFELGIATAAGEIVVRIDRERRACSLNFSASSKK